MLLEFRLENFKSFEDPTVFSMVLTPKQTDLEYSLLKKKITGNQKGAEGFVLIRNIWA